MLIQDHVPLSLHGVLALSIHRDGRLLERWQDRNVVCNGARQQLARLAGGSFTGRTIVNIGFGTGDGPADAANTTLTTPFIKPLAGVSYPTSTQVQFSFTLAAGDANGMLIREFGLICGDGTLFARRVRAGGLAKAADISISGTWTLTF